MKNLLIAFSTISLALTPVMTLTNETKISFVEKQNKIVLNNIIQSWEGTVQDSGRNDYNYYFGYHVLYLSHDLTTTLNNGGVAAGAAEVASILITFIPPMAPVAIIIAAILIAQWYIWNVPGYDNGSGVAIEMIGFGVPQYIIGISGQ